MNTIKKLYKEFFGLTEETNTIPKIGDASVITPNAFNYQEFQFLKPSLSSRASVNINYQHNCDEFYVVFFYPIF